MKHFTSLFVVATILIATVTAQFFYEVVKHGQGVALPEYHVLKVDGGGIFRGNCPFSFQDCAGQSLHLTNKMDVDVWLQRKASDTETVKLSPHDTVRFIYDKDYPWIVATTTTRIEALTEAEFREIVKPVAKSFNKKYNAASLKELTKKVKLLLGSNSRN
jgi:hypothetical protein